MTPPGSGERCNATLGEDRVVYQCSRPKGHTGQHRDGNVTAWDQKPDSGERYGEPCEVTDCIRRKGHAPPHTTEIMDDSGEREVCLATRTDRCERNSGHDGAHWPKPTEHATWKDDVLIPLPLAQRILAALETNDGWTLRQQVASELRAAVERNSGKECGHLLSADLGAEWRCGKPVGHEGPHSGTKP
jgi:hypothetical protein